MCEDEIGPLLSFFCKLLSVTTGITCVFVCVCPFRGGQVQSSAWPAGSGSLHSNTF